MKNYLFLIALFAACSDNNQKGNKNISVISNDTVPAIRKEVNQNAVASYMITIGNPALDYKFGVNIYETPETFKYLMRMQYEGMIVTDTLKVPNVGVWPKIVVKPGKEKMACIIGFMDKKDQFKEYKMLTVKDNDLKLTVLKRYSVGTYSTKAEE